MATWGAGSQSWGWSAMEGNHGFASASCIPSLYAPPAFEYGHDNGCSVTGGHVYRGRALPWLRGAYLFGDYCSAKIGSLRWIDGAATDVVDGSSELGTEGTMYLSSFGQDAAGEVYVVDYGGTVYRLDPG